MGYSTNGISIYPDYITLTPSTEGDSGSNIVIAAVGTGKGIALQYLKVQNIGDAEVTVVIKFGTTAIEKVLIPVDEAFTMWADDECREWRSAANATLDVDLSAAVNCLVTGRYRLVPA